MYQHTLSLAPGDHLQFNWEKGFKNFQVYHNDQLLGAFPDKKALKLGRRFDLPNHPPVMVILAQRGLAVWQNGADLMSGLKSGITDHFDTATSYLLGFSILQLVVGVIMALLVDDPTEKVAGLVAVILIGGILIGMSLWAKQSGSNTPLIIALVVMGLCIVLTLAGGSAGGIVITAIVMYQIYKGIKAGSLPKARSQTLTADGPLDAGV